MSNPKLRARTGSSAKPLILQCNDDGFFREEIRILNRALKSLGQTYIVAPDREKSATSLSLSLRHILRAHRIRPGVFAVDGTPADCIYLALQKLLPRRPDIVVSGMNPGPNIGQQDVNYSGTVAAAIQGTFLGIPSLAVSLLPDPAGRFHLDFGASVARQIISQVLAAGLPAGLTLNINIPAPPIKGIKITKLGWKLYKPEVIEKKDPRNLSYFWIGVGSPERIGDDETDVQSVYQGYVSITPLHTDMTDYAAMKLPLLGRIRKSVRFRP